MALQQWALPQISKLLPLDEDSLKQIITYSDTLPEPEAAEHLRNLLGDSPQALEFVTAFNEKRSIPDHDQSHPEKNGQRSNVQPVVAAPSYAPPAYPPPAQVDSTSSSEKNGQNGNTQPAASPSYAPPAYPPPTQAAKAALRRPHTNAVIEAAHERARDEQEMQQLLQNLQYQYNIYNSDIEPEHDTDYYCNCPIHRYQARKAVRLRVQDRWAAAVMYPGEKAYNDCYQSYGLGSSALFSSNPYRFRVISPYQLYGSAWGPQMLSPSNHAASVQQTIRLNVSLNVEAQRSIDAKEPKVNIWDEDLESSLSNMALANARGNGYPQDKKGSNEKRQSLAIPANGDSKRPSAEKRQSFAAPSIAPSADTTSKSSKFASFKKSIGMKTTEEKAVIKTGKLVSAAQKIQNDILVEEQGRWPDEQWRQMIAVYQEKVGMTKKISDLRARSPIQYLHLLRAGYFEPIPVAWANLASNPLKFSIEAAAGWRGITPAWRGYEDTAEERLYWVLNHREGSVGMRLKPDFISEMNMARARMASAVEPPPQYYSNNDVCHTQHTSEGYSRQVMPPPFRAYDSPEVPTDDTMILLDVSGSMEFDPVRPVYNQYLITGYVRSTQPKNKDVAKAVIRRFTDAMANHDHEFRGYDLITFANHAKFIGTINHRNLDAMWGNVRIGGGTRVMTGWQKVKEMHFEKHSASATHHPVYGWQAGPETPILRLLLLLDGEATDMDEFELDLLGLSWAHVTIFLIGVDGCPHHHRHANELQRISDVNHHVSFVDAQGNTPERFVTHELLKRHLGYEITMSEFESMEELPPYTE